MGLGDVHVIEGVTLHVHGIEDVTLYVHLKRAKELCVHTTIHLDHTEVKGRVNLKSYDKNVGII